jgi:hypothetical protein
MPNCRTVIGLVSNLYLHTLLIKNYAKQCLPHPEEWERITYSITQRLPIDCKVTTVDSTKDEPMGGRQFKWLSSIFLSQISQFPNARARSKSCNSRLPVPTAPVVGPPTEIAPIQYKKRSSVRTASNIFIGGVTHWK